MFLAVAEALAERGWRVELLAAGPEPALRAAVRPPLKCTLKEQENQQRLFPRY